MNEAGFSEPESRCPVSEPNVKQMHSAKIKKDTEQHRWCNAPETPAAREHANLNAAEGF